MTRTILCLILCIYSFPSMASLGELEKSLKLAIKGNSVNDIARLIKEGANLNLALSSYEASAVVYASGLCHVEATNLILKHKKQLSGYQKQINRALHAAADKNCLATVTLLLKKGANPFYKRRGSRSTIDNAIRTNKTDVIAEIIKWRYKDLNHPPGKHKPPLFTAIQLERHDVIDLFLEKGLDVNISLPSGITPLHMAVLSPNSSLVDRLIKAGAKINKKGGNKGSTPIILAGLKNNYRAVEILLKHGADIAIRDNKDQTIISYGVNLGITDIVDLVMQHRKLKEIQRSVYGELLHRAIAKPTNSKQLDLALKLDKDINKLDRSRQSPLIVAIQRSRPRAVEVLLKNKRVDVNIRNKGGRTALHEAVKKDNPELIRQLIKRKADIDVKSKRGYTPVYLAATKSLDGPGRVLVELGADINIIDRGGKTILHIIRNERAAGFYEALLKKGLHPNTTDLDGNTVLHETVSNGGGPILTGLAIKYGANVNAQNRRLEIPLHDAVYSSQIDVIKLLLENNADPYIANNKRRTPLHVAASRNKPALLKVMLNIVKPGKDKVDFLKSLTSTAAYGEGETIKVVLDYCKNQKLDCASEEALINASAAGKSETIRQIIGSEQKKIPASVLNAALRRAAANDRVDAISTLLEQGVDINNGNKKSNFTPLMAAVYSGRVNATRLLIRKGAELDLVDRENNTALLFAIRNNCYLCSIDLLKAGADPNILNNEGKGPLFHAADSRLNKDDKQKLVRMLIDEFGANTDTSRIKKRYSPLYKAQYKAFDKQINEIILDGYKRKGR